MMIEHHDLKYNDKLVGERFCFFIRDEKEFELMDMALVVSIDSQNMELNKVIKSKILSQKHWKFRRGQSFNLKKYKDGVLRVSELEKKDENYIEISTEEQFYKLIQKIVTKEAYYLVNYNYIAENFGKLANELINHMISQGLFKGTADDVIIEKDKFAVVFPENPKEAPFILNIKKSKLVKDLEEGDKQYSICRFREGINKSLIKDGYRFVPNL